MQTSLRTGWCTAVGSLASVGWCIAIANWSCRVIARQEKNDKRRKHYQHDKSENGIHINNLD